MFDYEPRTLLDAGPAGWLLLFGLAGAELSALAALPIAATASRDLPSKLLRILAVAGAALLALGIASAYFVVREAQGWILTQAPPPEGFPEHWSPWMAGMQRAEAAHGLIAIALLPIALFSGAAALLRALRSDTTKQAGASFTARSLAPWLAASAALLVAACSIGLLRRMHAGTHNLGCAIAILCEAAWFEKEVAAILTQTRIAILGIAALGSVALIFVARRSPKLPELSRRGLAASAVLFGLGLATFLGSRPMAHDARATLPRPESGAHWCPSLSYGAEHLPPIGESTHYDQSLRGRDGDVLELGKDGPRLDGEVISGPYELAERLKDRWKKWRETTLRPPTPIMVAISPEMPNADFAPYLLAIRDAYFQELSIITTQKASHFNTKALGAVPLRARCCYEVVRFFKDGVPLSQIPTWGALAEAAANHDDILYIALP